MFSLNMPTQCTDSFGIITLVTLITGYILTWVDTGYQYLVTVATHIGYLFYFVQTSIKRVSRQQFCYVTVTHYCITGSNADE